MLAQTGGAQSWTIRRLADTSQDCIAGEKMLGSELCSNWLPISRKTGQVSGLCVYQDLAL